MADPAADHTALRPSSDGHSSDRTRIIRRQPDDQTARHAAPAPTDAAPATSIIRRTPTGPVPVTVDASPTTFIRPPDDPPTAYVPRPTPEAVGSRHGPPNPTAASATATVAIISGWATAAIATSLITNWWRTDELFCIAVAFLTAVSAAGTIGGLIALLLRRRIGRLLVGVGAVVALMIFAGLFVAGAGLPAVIYAIPVLPVATVVLAALPATGRWCR